MDSNKENRLVILFGAGAAIAWGAPRTADLTTTIRNSGDHFTCIHSGQKITEFIYQTLISTGHSESGVNFETIINVIEEFIVHYSYFDRKGELPSLNKAFFSSKFENEILNFSVNGEKRHTYKLNIPNGETYNLANPSLNNESPEEFFFQHLLNVLIGNINADVIPYAYHSNTHSALLKPENHTLNSSFQNWIGKLSSSSICRMYTLNYDRIFKILAEIIEISVFDGFECGEFIPEDGIKPNVGRILTDFDSHTHYNLHGCSFWEVNSRDENTELLNPWISLQPFTILGSSSNENAVVQIEKGKSIVISNIVTGYQKAQKSFITPFKQMQAAFDKDCYLADEIYIIGYSFGDAHINTSIKAALTNNVNARIHLIDPIYSEKNGDKGYDILVDRLINIIPEFLISERTQPVYSNDNNTCTYFSGKLIVSSIGFNEYLELDAKTNN